MKKSLFFGAILLSAALITGCASTDQEEVVVKNEQPSLHMLILQGRTEEAQNLFFNKINVNELDSDRNTALHLAASMGSVEMVEYLLAQGADPTIKNRDGNTPIHVAILSRKYEVVRALAENGQNVFLTDKEGMNALDRIAEIESDLLYNAIITPTSVQIKNADGQTMIHYFILKKNFSAIQKCVAAGVNLSLENDDGLTPLALALKDTADPINIKIAAELIKARCEPVRGEFAYFEDTVRTYNVALRFTNNLTPLHMAVINNHYGIAKFLIDNGAVISAQDNDGSTPLHTAATYGRTEIARLLLECGANVNARDMQGRTPLLLVISKDQQINMYTTLLNYKADVHAKDNYGNTTLHSATMSEVSSLILNRLVKEGADVDARNESGKTPLALAVEQGLAEQVSFFINLGADINAEDKNRQTPLQKALKKADETGNQVIIHNLISSQNVTSRNSEGYTPLHIAVSLKSNIDSIRYIINSGADIDSRNADGDCILYTALKNNYREAGELLIKEGADIYSKNAADFSPLRYAMLSGGTLRDWFISSQVISGSDGNGNTPLHYAAEWRYDECITYLVSKGADVNKKNALGETPLYDAAMVTSVSTIKLLIQKGANPNARDLLGNTPLHKSVQWNTLDATRTLIEMGAIVDAKNISGKTPLSVAANYDSIDSAKILLENKANVNSSDITGKSILMDAVSQKSTKVIPFILAYGANVMLQDMYGRNAYHESASIKDVDIIEVLSVYGGNALSRDSFGKTPFSLVVNDSMSLINTVLGKDLKLIDSDGNNPLHAAIACKAKFEVMEQLIIKGYDINQRNSQGLTPLNYAIIQKQNSLARILIQHKADPFIADNNGDCAITLAFNNPDAVDVLDDLVDYFGESSDILGDTILHYAARTANEATLKRLLSFGLNRQALNNNGETPYDVAKRWKNKAGMDLLK